MKATLNEAKASDCRRDNDLGRGAQCDLRNFSLHCSGVAAANDVFSSI